MGTGTHHLGASRQAQIDARDVMVWWQPGCAEVSDTAGAKRQTFAWHVYQAITFEHLPTQDLPALIVDMLSFLAYRYGLFRIVKVPNLLVRS